MFASQICVTYVFFFFVIVNSQLNGGLLGILTPQGAQVSLTGLLGLSGRQTTLKPITTSTTTTTTTSAPIEITTSTKKPNTKKPSTSPNCNFTPTFIKGKRSCRGKLIFQETFAKLNENKWLIENRFSGEPDYEFVVYQNNSENLYITKNLLHIRPSLTEDKYGKGFVNGNEELNLGDSCTGIALSTECMQNPIAWQILPPVISAQISTKDHFTFVYGIIEVKARLPEGDWIYPEIYLKPKSYFYGSGYNSGIISLAFLPGNLELGKNLSAGVTLGQSEFARTFGMKHLTSKNRWNRDFHVFRVEWKPDEIVLSVDEKEYGKIIPPEKGFVEEKGQLEIDAEVAEKWKKGSKLAPFDKEMFLTLGVGVGGQRFTDNIANKPWSNDDPKGQLNFYKNQAVWSESWGDSNELLIDYVKIWAL